MTILVNCFRNRVAASAISSSISSGTRVEGGLGGHSQISPNIRSEVELEIGVRSLCPLGRGWYKTK